jgi:nucleolar protein 14
MAEVMAKSKSYKAERQHQNDLDADLRDALDDEMGDLRALLQEGPSEPANFRRQPVSDKEDAEYAQFVKSLAFEARAKPKDRTKTEDELAIEEKERLEKAEAKRLRRMRGEESEDEDSRGKKRKIDDRREGDDLGDDFIDEDEEDLLGPGLTREGLEDMGAAKAKALEDAEEEDEEGSEDGEEEDDEDEEEDGEDSEEEEDESDDAETSDMEDLDEDPDVDSEDEGEVELVTKRKRKSTAKTTEIPYTFICPSSIDELEDIMEPLDDSAIPTVVQRIRAIHHPSLAQGNKEKLQVGSITHIKTLLTSRNSLESCWTTP